MKIVMPVSCESVSVVQYSDTREETLNQRRCWKSVHKYTINDFYIWVLLWLNTRGEFVNGSE